MWKALDEPIEVAEYNLRWPAWYKDDAAEIRRALGNGLRMIEHFGSTAVVGLAAKPIIDVLVAPIDWPLRRDDRHRLESLGYEYFGEAGVPGREYLRRRAHHATNLAIVEWDGSLWRDNIALRDYLRCHPDIATAYGRAKQRAWSEGARTLLRYSAAKAESVAALVADAKSWTSR